MVEGYEKEGGYDKTHRTCMCSCKPLENVRTHEDTMQTPLRKNPGPFCCGTATTTTDHRVARKEHLLGFGVCGRAPNFSY